MNRIIFGALVFVSSFGHADSVIPESCLVKVSYDIVRFLEKEESSADIRLVKDARGLVIGLRDAQGYFADYELTSVSLLKSDRASIVFHAADSIVFAEVFLGTKAKPNCRVTSIDMGQDDHD